MNKATDNLYRMFDYFTGRLEPEDREEYLDALSTCFNLQLPWRVDEDFKNNKQLDQDIPIKFKKWLCERLIKEDGQIQIGKDFYGNMEPFKNLPKKYFYDDSSIMEAFKRIAEAQAREKSN
tara:strand:- start:3904 stop:4266 length:363 start_codon:yes stop_codon:yes gene_type:complete